MEGSGNSFLIQARNSEVLYGISTECTSPAYRIAFLKKAIRNLSKAFSFF